MSRNYKVFITESNAATWLFLVAASSNNPITESMVYCDRHQLLGFFESIQSPSSDKILY